MGHGKESRPPRYKDQCQPCLQGMYCPNYGTVYAVRSCEEGYYCPTGTANPTLNVSLICLPGHMCPSGSAFPTKCTLGKYQPLEGQGNCLTCPAGYTCGDKDGTVVESKCPAGSECPPGSFEISLCEPGKYQELPGSSSCKPCPSGNYCNAAGGTVFPILCDAGHACPAKSINATSCLPGMYQDSAGSDSCKTCPQGKHADERQRR